MRVTTLVLPTAAPRTCSASVLAVDVTFRASRVVVFFVAAAAYLVGALRGRAAGMGRGVTMACWAMGGASSMGVRTFDGGLPGGGPRENNPPVGEAEAGVGAGGVAHEGRLGGPV